MIRRTPTAQPRPVAQAATAAPDPIGLLGDGTVLRDLLALAGPEVAAQILAQMRIDLAEVAAALSPALGPLDWAVMRRETHVLISVAGTIGAGRLHALAIDLNTAAHDRDPAQAAALAAPLMSDLTALIALLQAQSHVSPAGTGPDAGAAH